MSFKTEKITNKELEAFNFLNDLRETMVTNMFGASKYVEKEFGISRSEASRITNLWMVNFNLDGYDHLEIIED